MWSKIHIPFVLPIVALLFGCVLLASEIQKTFAPYEEMTPKCFLSTLDISGLDPPTIIDYEIDNIP